MEQIARRFLILKLIVEEFIKTAKPVGSQTLIDAYDLKYSSATIRNEMFSLEEDGYIEKPHTSSGRIPSAKGYRYYIDNLRSKDEKANIIKERLNQFIDENGNTMHTDQIIDRCCEIISNMTNLVSVVLGPDNKSESIAKVELIPLNFSTAIVMFVTNNGYVEHRTISIPKDTDIEELKDCIKIIDKRIHGISLENIKTTLDGVQLVLSEHIKNYESVFNAFANTFLNIAKDRISYFGRNNLLSQKDFADIEKIKRIAGVLENTNIWKSFDNEEGIYVSIGKENKIDDLSDVSVVSTRLKVNDNKLGSVCVIGPTRMDYNQVIEALEFLNSKLEELDENKKEKPE
ncbi:MAG: heat-inducible transcriptional repressor HrcA [Erysipelotrichaceae bacterium]|nr:heat-inducible transcriptional repressor HrcA [Erysipelotrichaceae bacterium]